MALYYNLVFLLLVVEMAFFAILSLPYPRKVRRAVLTTVSAPFRNDQFQIALKCVLGFVAILFIDSVNRVYSVTAELNTVSHTAGGASIMNERSEVQARRFYAQRNMYLCGFTLFLHLILIRTYSLVAELIVTKDKLDDLKETKTENVEVARLRKELAEKEEDLEILKGQAKGLSNDYEEIASKGKLKSRD
ncbi:YET3 [[Candida] subhashii]|uniref:Endoplasmic reticulum transmembrane protein n=1 Tax=[Candida] subhashii TaxID=561895 RepID=A0A8J5QPV3_9ASCO|nr:YET3 [[Candida] subhashii]KAG7665349.1 YET3 [[Candida] subhashii]